MQHVGSAEGAAPVAFDACAAALKLGGVPAPDAPGAHGTGALAGAARRLHDVASILIRIGVLEFCEPEGRFAAAAISSGSARSPSRDDSRRGRRVG